MMDFLNSVLIKPFADMFSAPDFLLQVLWEGLVSGVLMCAHRAGFRADLQSPRASSISRKASWSSLQR